MATAAGTASGTGSYNFKVVLLGEGCVGKTSVVLRYVQDRFNERHHTTLQVKTWVKELKKMLGSEMCLIIAGNKVDLEKQRNVSVEDAEEYARSVGAKHFHTSAKLNQGIEEMFLELSQRMIERAKENDQQKASSLGRAGSTRRNVVVVEDDEEAAQPKSGCCGGVSAAS